MANSVDPDETARSSRSALFANVSALVFRNERLIPLLSSAMLSMTFSGFVMGKKEIFGYRAN